MTEEDYRARYYTAQCNYNLTVNRHGLCENSDMQKKKAQSIAALLYTPEGYITFGSCFAPQDATKPDELQEIDEQLRERARVRGFSNRHEKLLLSLMQRQREEYKDIIQLQNVYFLGLAKEYFDLTYGELNRFIESEVKARREIEDLEVSEGLVLLKALREYITACEERILRRTFDKNRLSRVPKQDEETSRSPPTLDHLYAAPLLQRAMVIREEIISEENIAFINIQLGMVTQADLISRGFLMRNSITGALQAVPLSSVPFYFRDSMIYAFKSEALCIQLDEETQRMKLEDKKENALRMLVSAFSY